MNKRLSDFLDSREFYELSQAYRHAPVDKPGQVVLAWDALKAAIRDASVPDAGKAFGLVARSIARDSVGFSELHCVLCCSVLPPGYIRVTCEACISAGKLL